MVVRLVRADAVRARWLAFAGPTHLVRARSRNQKLFGWSHIAFAAASSWDIWR